MPSPRVFVSSTAYDLRAVRGQLRSFIASVGFEPVLSEFSDVLFDPRVHAQTSCLKEVLGCDMLVLLIGSRFGSEAIPEALQDLDLDAVRTKSANSELLDGKLKLSVTQAEVFKAIELGIPMFTFIEDRVLHDHDTYEANRDNRFLPEMRFSSIETQEAAPYIFGFIDFIRQRVANNSIVPFARMDDIEQHLTRQWAQLFQRLLEEQRGDHVERERIDRLTEQFDDLKTAILTSIGDAGERRVAQGVVTFRQLIDELRSIDVPDLRRRVEEEGAWEDLLTAAGVVEIRGLEGQASHPLLELALKDGSVLQSRMSLPRFRRFAEEWSQLLALPAAARLTIYDTLADAQTRPMVFRRRRNDDNETLFAAKARVAELAKDLES